MDQKKKAEYLNWIEALDDREEKWMREHPEEAPAGQKQLTTGKANIEVRECNNGFWEVYLDGRMVWGSGGKDAQQRATAKAAEILKGFE